MCPEMKPLENNSTSCYWTALATPRVLLVRTVYRKDGGPGAAKGVPSPLTVTTEQSL